MTPRRALSSIILVIALIGGSIAYTSFIARRVTNEPDTVADAASQVVNQPVIRDQMVDEITDSILGYIGPGLTANAGGVDPAAEARSIAEATVDTPEYEEAVRETLINFHEMAFVGPQGKLFIDVAGVTDAVRVAAVAQNPIYGPMLPDDAELLVASPISDVPDLTAVKNLVNGVFGWSLLIAVAGLAAAFALHDKRARVLRRVGLWAMLLAAGHLLVAWVLPRGADWYVDEIDDVPIGETLTRAVVSFVRAPAVFVFVGGVILVVISFVWPMVSTSGRFASGAAGRTDQPAGSVEPTGQAPYPPTYPAAPPVAYPAAVLGSPPPPPPPGARPVGAADPAPTAAMPTAQPPPGRRPGDEAFAPPSEDPAEGDSVFGD